MRRVRKKGTHRTLQFSPHHTRLNIYGMRTARLKRSPRASLRTKNTLSLDGRDEDTSLGIAFGVLSVLPVNPQWRVNVERTEL